MRRMLLLAIAMLVTTSSMAGARLNEVRPWEFDPYGTSLVQSEWLARIGCPTNATINTGTPGTYSDPACPVRVGPTDRNHKGLLLSKQGPTANIASAGAELRGVAGEPLNSIGYDIRKNGGAFTERGSHCGAGAPRFNVVTDFGTHFIGCVSPPPVNQVLGLGWTRLAWSPATAFPPVPPGATVRAIDIVYDEGQDTGPDHFGMAILDNIMVNGTYIGLD